MVCPTENCRGPRSDQRGCPECSKYSIECAGIIVYNRPMEYENEKMIESSLHLLKLDLISRLKMSHEERIEAHENALQLSNDLKKAREVSYAESQSLT